MNLAVSVATADTYNCTYCYLSTAQYCRSIAEQVDTCAMYSTVRTVRSERDALEDSIQVGSPFARDTGRSLWIHSFFFLSFYRYTYSTVRHNRSSTVHAVL